MPRNEATPLVDNLGGVDLLADATAIAPNRFRRLENLYPPRGSLGIIAKRLGSAKYNATAISGATGIDNGVRAWLSDGTKRLIVAANKAGNDELHYGDDTLGTFTQITGGTALPSGARWFFVNWPLLGKVYALSGDASVPVQISSNFTTKSDMTIGAGATDARFGQFGAVFFSRLVTARTPSNPAYVYYFNVADDATIGAAQFWRHREPVTALAKHTFGTQSDSLNEMLIVWGTNTMGFVPGDPSSATLQQGPQIGNLSPKAAVNTDLGLMFLGTGSGGDRNVYLVGADPRFPTKVGSRIYPELRMIPAAQFADACAVYHDGFYKLSFAGGGGATNDIQYWADLLPVMTGMGEIEWYGPMTGQQQRCFVLFDAPGDSLTLRAGDDAAGTVWKLDETGSYVDGSSAITSRFYSKEFDEGDRLREKIWNGFTFGILEDETGALQVTIILDSGRASSPRTLTWTGAGALWDSAVWDSDLWGGTQFVEEALNWDERLVGRVAQIQGVHTATTDFRLRDFGRKAKVIGRML